MADNENPPHPDESTPLDKTAFPPRPGSHPSQPPPTNSSYLPDLPLAEDLQALLSGAYVVESFLGQGGMGAVYRGLQMPLRRPVAIKILQKRQAGAEDDFAFEERFKREAYAMAALTHPHIVQVYDCGDAGENFLFISMELVEGGDLSDAIKAGQVTPEVALKLIPQICDGLQAAHDRGLVHRDIKPANIFLTADGRAKVADFGLAKKFDAKNTMVTKTGLGMGTPDYAAPEQYEAVADLDHRADIYALGVMMYQMLTGRLPRGATYKTPSQLAGVDPRIDAVVAKAMATEREDRYQSTAEIKTDLTRILATPQQATVVPVTMTGAVPTAARPATGGRPVSGGRVVTQPARQAGRPATAVPMAVAEPEKKGPNVVVIGSILVVVIGLGAMFLLKRGDDATPLPSIPAKAVSPAAPAAAATAPQNADATPFPTGQWVKVLKPGAKEQPALAITASQIDWRGKLLDGSVKSPVLRVLQSEGRNYGIRVRGKLDPANAKPMALQLMARRDNAGATGYRLTLNVTPGATNLVLARMAGAGPAVTHATIQNPVARDAEVDMQLVTIGDRLHARLNGRTLPVTTDPTVKSGHLVFQSSQLVSDAEVINLDGLSDEDAMKAAGIVPPVGSPDSPAFPPGQWTKIGLKDVKLTSGEVRGDKAVLAAESMAYLPGPEMKNAVVRLKVRRPADVPRGFQIKQRAQGGALVTSVYAAVPSAGPVQGLIQVCLADSAEKFGRQLACDWLQPDQESTFDFVAVDDLYALIVDGRTVVTFRDDRLVKSGKASFLAGRGVTEVRDIEVLPLDGLTEDQYPEFVKQSLAKVRANPGQGAPTPPDSAPASQDPFPVGQWVKRFTTIEHLRENQRKADSGVEWKDGVITAAKSTSIFPMSEGQSMRNGGWRMAVKKGTVFEMRLRNAGRPREHFYAANGGRLYYADLKDGGMKQTTLLTLPPSKAEEDWRHLEIIAVGSRLIVRGDGALAGVVQHDQIAEGYPVMTNFRGTMRDVEVLNLDGLSEAEALRIAGVDEAGNDVRKPGSVSSSPAPRASSSPGTVPRGQWVKVFNNLAELSRAGVTTADKKITYIDGWFVPSVNAIDLRIDQIRGTNLGIRGRFKQTRERIAFDVLSDASSHRFTTFLGAGTMDLSIPHESKVLFTDKAVVDPQQGEFTMEYACIGGRYIARLDGKLAFVLNGQKRSNVRLGVYNSGAFRDIEVINLDGIPEAEALRILGVDEKGNDLRALAAQQEQQMAEQAKAADAIAAIPELQQLHEQFLKLQTERVTAPFEADVEKLNTGYLGGLDRAIAEEKQAGHLDGVVAIEAEKKLIAEKHALPAADDEKTTEALKKLRAIYRASFAKLDAQRTANLKSLTEPLSARLTALEAELTKKNRLADAKTVREYRERLVAGTQADTASSGAPDDGVAMTGGAASASTPPAGAASARTFSPNDDRKAAEWAFSVGGTVEVQERDERRSIRKVDDLPKGRFDLVGVSIDKARPATPPTMEFSTLEPLAGLKKLERVETHYLPVSDADTDVLASLPSLRSCVIYDTKTFTGARLGLLRNLEKLEVMVLPGTGLNAEGLQALSTLKQLTRLDLSNTFLDDSHVESLDGRRNLRALALRSVKVTATGLSRLKQLDGVTEFGWTLQPGSVEEDARVIAGVFPKLEQLGLSFGTEPSRGEFTAALAKFPLLYKVYFASGIKATDETGKALADTPTLTHLLFMPGTLLTDATFEALAEHKKLKGLRLENVPGLTRKGIMALTRIKTFNRLELISNPQIDDATLAEFRKARPDVTVTR